MKPEIRERIDAARRLSSDQAESAARMRRSTIQTGVGDGDRTPPGALGRTKATERHYTAAEVAELWQLSINTIRRIFYEEPDVIVVRRPMGKSKQRYRTLRIPASVLERVHRRLEVA